MENGVECASPHRIFLQAQTHVISITSVPKDQIVRHFYQWNPDYLRRGGESPEEGGGVPWLIITPGRLRAVMFHNKRVFSND